jgi:hypothetical protein
MKDNRISEEEYDRLSDNQQRNFVWCADCRKYHPHGSECVCGLKLQLSSLYGVFKAERECKIFDDFNKHIKRS